MLRPFVSARRALACGLFAFVLTAAGFARTDRTFTTSDEMATEARTLVGLLETGDYNRDAVKPADYAEVVTDYMGLLDGQRLFFLAGDKTAFDTRYAKNLYWNVSQLGNIDAAYDIFKVYTARVDSRVNWIRDELKRKIGFTRQETYQFDRSKAGWPASRAEADDLWRRRLKFELLAEILNKKTPEQARDTVLKRYERMSRDMDDLESSDLDEMFLTSIAGLYDPHSNYFSADTYADFNIQMRLSLVGIGAMLKTEDDYCVISEIVPGSPADLSKLLHPNDKIIAVAPLHGEAVDITGMQLRKIVDLIRGAKGSKVRLTIIPAGATDPSTRKEITLTRNVVKLNSARARAAVFDVPAADGKSTVPIGVITLPSFYGPMDEDGSADPATSASKDVAKLIVQLKAAGIRGLVLDLRGNGGGLLSEAVEISGLFIGQGPVVQVKDYQGSIRVQRDTDPGIAYSGPLAVLVDRFSASASEIVTGALQDYGRAIVIGDSSTHGKGTVQTVVEMKDIMPGFAGTSAKTGAAKITIQKFYLPDGSSTQLKGVVPDIILPSVDDYLPIGEKALPHALVWDVIPSSFFDGAPLDPATVKILCAESLARQRTLPEFSLLKESIGWFKDREEQKYISLNLDERRREKVAEDSFRKTMEARRKILAQADFKYREFHVGPPLPPPIVAPANPADPDPSADGDDDTAAAPTDAYATLDIPLRESLRVINDAVVLGRNHRLWANDHAPLTAVAADKS